MKSLHLTNCWHPQSGGIRTFYTALMEAAEARGHQIRLVVPAETSSVEPRGKYGKIYHVQAPPAPRSPGYRILYPHRMVLPGGDVHRILKHERPDLVEFCDKFTMNYLGGLLRRGFVPGLDFRPSVVGLSCERLDRTVSTYVSRHPFWTRVTETYLRWLYFPFADHHIAVSQLVAEELRAVAAGHDVERGVWLSPMGVDLGTFRGVRPNRELRSSFQLRAGGDSSTVLAVYAGRLAAEKNLPLLVETMRQLVDLPDGHRYRLIVAGDGPMRRELEMLAESAVPGAVHFAGYFPGRRDLAELLSSCDVFLHPNPSEPFGIGPLEAMAAGIPVVAPNSGGVLSYASPSNAWLADPTPEAFSQAVTSLLNDSAERERRVARAIQTAGELSWERAAGRYVDLYRQLHARTQGTPPAAALEPVFSSTRRAS
jgi:glycosyltransferase involved in cell wall biosynthesis